MKHPRESAALRSRWSDISCTVWEGFENFDAWKKGDAFKEAHGGGTIGGVASMLLATAMNTKGKPKAAMWEGLLPVSMPTTDAVASNDGWREVAADGETMLDVRPRRTQWRT